jgi:hypothetical protein
MKKDEIKERLDVLTLAIEQIMIMQKKILDRLGTSHNAIDYNSIKHLQGITMTNSEKCEHNLKTLNDMMLQLKGVIAMVRPLAAKNEWYGQEIEGKTSKIEIDTIEMK